ncbi:hypothetical protein [Conexibacter sp. CPCC 206217]|uniref:hypothetical protein n=1 Tax=Conexibacter sp. CPCC 206217 TaxID=3064574 RepID=UPI0027168506|nr:hypothetical protein [Conexibacter sp. CPCC 206217]MDO8209146.1 hypothetical protein [Conexibacter sp. CPCC 206217]
MTTAGWIFLVGMRVFDVGGLIVWLVWFFRREDEPDDWSGWDDPGDGPPPDRPDSPDPGGSGLRLPLPDAAPWPTRLRDHAAAGPQRAIERRKAPVERPQRERTH